MFLDTRDPWPPHDPWTPPPHRPALSRPHEKVVIWLVALNFLLLFLAPIAGITLFDVALALWRQM